MVEGMGGKIGVESEENQGSRFWFELPLEEYIDSSVKSIQAFSDSPISQVEIVSVSGQPVEPKIEPAIKKTDPVQPVQKSAVELLLVEDNKINQKLAMALIQRLDLTADLAEDGREAVAAAGKKQYALILMDMQMPEMDGIEATKKIRLLEGPNMKTPIIALTANAMKDDRDACLAAGMDDFLTKPINRDSFKACLNQWIAAPKIDSEETAVYRDDYWKI
jgi:CheY-like chemotaxis protein